MNLNKQIEAAAIIFGITQKTIDLHKELATTQPWMDWNDYPEFWPHEDHNILQLLIDGMDEETLINYAIALERIFYRPDAPYPWHKATCAQKLEAILKAYDAWEDDE